MSKWGFYNVSGVEFFLERGRIPALCPIETPDCDCPHVTTGEPKRLPFKTDRVYLSRERPFFTNVVWDDDVYFYGTRSFKQIENACETTQEYVPLVVRNLRQYDKTDEIFRRSMAIVAQSKRPIVFVSEDYDWIVCPEFVERI